MKSVIFGFSGLNLTQEEIEFFNKFQPLGFIIFRRNIDNPSQVLGLIEDLKKTVKHQPLILIDQEGGRVARLKPPHWPTFPAMNVFWQGADNDLEKTGIDVFDNYYKIGIQLAKLGINVDCAPVADLLHKDAHDIVGDRSFGSDVEKVSYLARKAAEGLLKAKIMPVIKHIPGHGRAKVDSHEDLPIIKTDLKTLMVSDFKVFANLKDIIFAMTAHIVYEKIDPLKPATLSKTMIKLIREEIGYEGIIMTDDISMKALRDSLPSLVEQATKAGCDIILHCNGNMQEMSQIAPYTEILSENLISKIWKN